MAEEKTPIEKLIETAMYAPLGIMAMLREELPKLVSRGQQEANMAKMMGQFAVGMGRSRSGEASQLVHRARQARRQSRPVARTRRHARRQHRPRLAPRANRGNSVPAPARHAVGNGNSVTVHDAQSLAIPGYDCLSASQVVQRLAGLNPSELAAIGSYEAAGRGRRTILNRVAQLRDA